MLRRKIIFTAGTCSLVVSKPPEKPTCSFYKLWKPLRKIFHSRTSQQTYTERNWPVIRSSALFHHQESVSSY